MKTNNLKLKLIMMLHPNYKLVRDNLCDTYSYDNLVQVYTILVYAEFETKKGIRFIKYKEENYISFLDINNKIELGERIPLKPEKLKKIKKGYVKQENYVII